MSSPSTHEMDQIHEPLETPAQRAHADQLEAEIAAITSRNIRSLRVHIQGDIAIITGHAESFHVKQLATHAIIHDVVRVQNEIVVG